MQYLRLLPLLLGIAILPVLARASDTPAQAAARAALEQQMNQMGDQTNAPTTAPAAGTEMATNVYTPAPAPAPSTTPTPSVTVSPQFTEPQEPTNAPAPAVATPPPATTNTPPLSYQWYITTNPPAAAPAPQMTISPQLAMPVTNIPVPAVPAPAPTPAIPAPVVAVPAPLAMPQTNHMVVSKMNDLTGMPTNEVTQYPVNPPVSSLSQTNAAAAPIQVPPVTGNPPPATIPAPPPQFGTTSASAPTHDATIVPAQAPISADKQAQLQQLLSKYLANEITPAEYQQQRAEILAQP